MDSLRNTLDCDGKQYHYHDLHKLGDERVHRLPISLKILLENQLRHLDGEAVTEDHIDAFLRWVDDPVQGRDISFSPARVLMQDFTGVPAIVDLAAMRESVAERDGDVTSINPQVPVDLVIDHSVSVDHFASGDAFRDNVSLEMERNRERYRFLKWGQSAFDNFYVVPPGTGICHQVNLEYLGKVVWPQQDENGEWHAWPDTLVGTDSHTPMINGLGVLGWGVGGIEAEAALLGQPYSMLLPEVVGVELTGELAEGTTATDLVLTIVEMLRKHGVVGKLVEFHGPGLANMTVADRATIANMAPEYGATCGFFPPDEATLHYLQLTGREPHQLELVKRYCQAQGMWRDDDAGLVFTDKLQLDLGTVVPSLAGPRRPQDRVALGDMKNAMQNTLKEYGKSSADKMPVREEGFDMPQGAVVIAAITSCTNTSNPDVMIGAGLVARKARERGLKIKPWVKTSLAPGSKVVSDYLTGSGLQEDLDALGFNLVGYGCTTCIGNSGPLPDPIAKAIGEQDVVSAVLSGNRNFEGRIHNQVRAAWLASPPLVVAFAIAGTTMTDLHSEALGEDSSGKPVYLKDLWPTPGEIEEIRKAIDGEMFHKAYSDLFEGTEVWQALEVEKSPTYPWESSSTYIQCPPFFQDMHSPLEEFPGLRNARILALLGDSVTTDHVSPAGSIALESPAGKYLRENGVEPRDFNSYGSRRGNHEVMMRGTFANVRLRNKMASREGGYTTHHPSGEEMSIYDAAMRYQEEKQALVVFAGEQYGSGSSRDWAAKGPRLLGVRAVVAQSFERIHRSNLIGMGVLPVELDREVNLEMLQLRGEEEVDVLPLQEGEFKPGQQLRVTVSRRDGTRHEALARSRIDTAKELDYFRHGGILHYVLQQLEQRSA